MVGGGDIPENENSCPEVSKILPFFNTISGAM